jgi:hypothetical protein
MAAYVDRPVRGIEHNALNHCPTFDIYQLRITDNSVAAGD